jgi:hypothetical protein
MKRLTPEVGPSILSTGVPGKLDLRAGAVFNPHARAMPYDAEPEPPIADAAARLAPAQNTQQQ